MKISKQAYYGLRAVVSLAATTAPISARELSKTERIPEDFLEKILQKLRRSGIVESKKGTDGGYLIGRPTRNISVWDILNTLDGPVRTFVPPITNALPASNATSVASAGWPCPPYSHCQTNEVWRMLEGEIEKTLTKITLEKLTRHHL